VFTFKAGVVEGRVVDLKQVEAIASLPSKEELISQLLFVINAQAQRIVTVINAVPRNLAVVIKQIGDAKPAGAAEQKAETSEAPPAAETAVETSEAAPSETDTSSEQSVSSEDGAPAAEQSAEEPALQEDAAPETAPEQPE
ncbi:MAG TPA: hypothetical protein VF692_11875, partial [Pyrinomonadaceae bacterium]